MEKVEVVVAAVAGDAAAVLKLSDFDLATLSSFSKLLACFVDVEADGVVVLGGGGAVGVVVVLGIGVVVGGGDDDGGETSDKLFTCWVVGFSC